MTVLKNGPDVSTAARNGAPTMTPASESGDETIGFSLQPNANVATGSSVGSTAAVETITPGKSRCAAGSLRPDDSTTGGGATPCILRHYQCRLYGLLSQPAAASGASTDSTSTQPAATTSRDSRGFQPGIHQQEKERHSQADALLTKSVEYPGRSVRTTLTDRPSCVTCSAVRQSDARSPLVSFRHTTASSLLTPPHQDATNELGFIVPWRDRT